MPPISRMFASWTDLKQLVPVEHSTVPKPIPSIHASKGQVKAHFQQPEYSAHPIACPRLHAPGIPDEVDKINRSRNNPAAIQ